MKIARISGIYRLYMTMAVIFSFVERLNNKVLNNSSYFEISDFLYIKYRTIRLQN